jgi:transposase
LGRGRGGFGSKFHLVTDGSGIPLAVEVTAGQVHESTRFESVVATFIASRRHRRCRRLKPRQLAGDKAYSVRRVRDWLRTHGIEPVIPHQRDEHARHDPLVSFDRAAYRQRAVVEQCVGWLKECRRIGTRFEKLAVNFHGMLQLAMIWRYFKLLFSDRAWADASYGEEITQAGG